MTTLTDAFRANFNGDITLDATSELIGSVGDLFLFDNFVDKAIWLEDSNGNRLATSPQGFDLPFTGPTWHLAAAADFDNASGSASVGVGGSNPTFASDLLWVNDNGSL